jgi:uncharacterized membrane protein
MARKITHIGSHKQTELWVAPIVGSVLAAVLAAASLTFDAYLDFPIPGIVFSGQADTARQILDVIASSVTTLLALIFTVIAVVIQLASGHYSPRTLAMLLADRPSHFTVGVFVGTFTYSLIIMLGFDVTLSPDGEHASGISMTLAFVLAVITIATFAMYANHIIHAVRVTSLVGLIGRETRKAISRLYPEPFDSGEEHEPVPPGPPDFVVTAPFPGVLSDFDRAKLVAEAQRRSVLVVVPPAGGYVPEGAPLLDVFGGDGRGLEKHVDISPERSFERDVAFGFRQLSDIALRATSTGVNDPATAVQALDHIHDMLRNVSQRHLGVHVHRDSRGVVRVIEHTATWEGLLRLGIAETMISGASSPQVARKLRYILNDLLEVAPEARRPEIQRLLQLLDRMVERSYEDEDARAIANEPDSRGTGF